MQPLDLNLATKPFRNNVLLWTGYLLATGILAVATWFNVVAYNGNRTALADLRDEATSFESQRRELETRAHRALQGIRRFDLDALQTQVDKANEVIEWKAFSWTGLFNEMERIQPNDVKMNVVRPIFHGRNAPQEPELTDGRRSMPVAIEGRAKTFFDFTELEHRLQDDPRFGRVEPDRYNRAENGEVLFQLRFLYYPDEARDLSAAERGPEGAPSPLAVAESAMPEELPPVATVEADGAPEASAGSLPAPVEVEEDWRGVPAEEKAEAPQARPRPERGRGQVERRSARPPAQGGRMGRLKPRPQAGEEDGDERNDP